MRQLSISCVVILSSLSLGANPSIGSDTAVLTDNGFSDNTPISTQEEFLPVEKAYQVQVDINNRELSLLWTITPGYYLYKDRFALSAHTDNQPIALTPRFETGKVKYDEYFEKEVETYYHGTEINAAIPDGADRFDLVVTSQGCADAGLCYPPYKHYFHIDMQTGVASPQTAATASRPGTGGTYGADGNTSNSDVPLNTQQSATAFLPYVLVLAMLGGVILNLMPCVFPVLSIKALSLASASQSPHSQRLHGWVYTAGVVFTFLIIAGAMLAVRAGGQAVGWGFQLQSPLFISFLAYLFFIMGLSLSGLVDVGTRWMGAGQSLTGGTGMQSSFFTGILAAVVASPCTAPMMGTALGYAMTQPTTIALSVFAALGFGMALPFLLLSYTPHVARYMPAPGPWMETLKQCMAFPLYLAAIWLLWILGHQINSDAVILLSIGGVLITFALWLGKQSFSANLSRSIRNLTVAGAFAGAAVIPFYSQDPDTDDHWEVYTEARLTQLRDAGEPVLVNLTADWCITCLANEKIALNTDRVNTAIAISGIYTLKGDWTNYNPEITRLLTRYGRNGVPLYLLYPAVKGASATVLPQLLTENTVLQAIKRATPTQTALN